MCWTEIKHSIVFEKLVCVVARLNENRGMDIYLVTLFSNSEQPAVINTIKTMLHGVGSINVINSLPLHSTDRESVCDYSKKVAFSFFPDTKRVYKLDNIPVFIDISYTTLTFVQRGTVFYSIFKSDLTNNVWNVIRHLLPSPCRVYNSVSSASFNTNFIGNETDFFVSSALKPALLDHDDF